MDEKQNELANHILHTTLPLLLKAGELLRTVDSVGEGITAKSGDANFVTRYDVAVQDLLTENLGRAFPDACFYAEEKENGALTDALTFIIDPIDGTMNFIRGLRHSCISVGVCEGGVPFCGFVYHPYADLLYYAVRGGGAYRAEAPSMHGLEKTKRLTIPDSPLADTLAVIGTDPYHKSTSAKTTLRAAKVLLGHALDIRRSGSAALDLSYVASGCYGIFYENCVSPWDYAAGRLLVSEAGGVVMRADGTDLPICEVTSILAGTPTACKEFLSLMKEEQENL